MNTADRVFQSPKSKIRREIFGERPLAPLKNIPVVFEPRTPMWRPILWRCLAIVAALFLLKYFAGLLVR